MDSPSVLPRQPLAALLRAVVKVMTVSDPPDYDQPWQTRGVSSSAGSGVVVRTERGPRVLTNGHCVENHVFVEVRRDGDSTRHVAEVEAVGHECDLALLRVDDDFFEDVIPVAFGGLPRLSDVVAVCGYPIGGDRLSITQGIVSRIDLVRYTHSQRRLLGVQIDAAINDGNSGGPVLQEDRLAGIAFQSLEDAEQIGYVIPTDVVEHFLRDVARGAGNDGFPDLGVVAQPLESEAHRRSLGLAPEGERGVLVVRVGFESSAWGILREGDVLLEVDGIPIAADGTVALRDHERVDFDFVVSRRHTGESATVKVWRDGAALDCMVPLRPPRPLVAESRYDLRPSYYVFGGLLFVPLTRDYLRTWDDPWCSNAPEELVALYDRGLRTPDRIEPVVLQKVLADRANQGYHDVESALVERAQGQRVRSLRHLAHLIETSRKEFVQVELHDGRRIVVDRRLALERHRPILERYGVPEDRSRDLLDTRRRAPGEIRGPQRARGQRPRRRGRGRGRGRGRRAARR